MIGRLDLTIDLTESKNLVAAGDVSDYGLLLMQAQTHPLPGNRQTQEVLRGSLRDQTAPTPPLSNC